VPAISLSGETTASGSAEDGVIENIVTEAELRTVLGQSVTMLMSKRVSTLPT